MYQSLTFNEPTVLIDETNQSIDLETDPEWYDLFVFHPRTEFIHDVSYWILKSKKMQIFEIPKVEINCPCKVLLFEEGDNIQKAVPTYMVEIPTLKEEVNMPIEKDIKYKILIGNNEIAYLLE